MSRIAYGVRHDDDDFDFIAKVGSLVLMESGDYEECKIIEAYRVLKAFSGHEMKAVKQINDVTDKPWLTKDGYTQVYWYQLDYQKLISSGYVEPIDEWHTFYKDDENA